MGSMPPKSTAVPSSPSSGGEMSLMVGSPLRASSDVEEAHVLGVGLDEVLARLDVVAHQLGEDLVGHDGGLDANLQQGATLGVHGGLAQLVVVHLAEALEALELALVVGVLGEEGVLGGVVLE